MPALWKMPFLVGHSEIPPKPSSPLHPKVLKTLPTGLMSLLHFPAACPLFRSSFTSTSHPAPRRHLDLTRDTSPAQAPQTTPRALLRFLGPHSLSAGSTAPQKSGLMLRHPPILQPQGSENAHVQPPKPWSRHLPASAPGDFPMALRLKFKPPSLAFPALSWRHRALLNSPDGSPQATSGKPCTPLDGIQSPCPGTRAPPLFLPGST